MLNKTDECTFFLQECTGLTGWKGKEKQRKENFLTETLKRLISGLFILFIFV